MRPFTPNSLENGYVGGDLTWPADLRIAVYEQGERRNAPASAANILFPSGTADPRELLMNILRHGQDVEVLTPTQLREQGRMRVEETVGRYGTKQGATSVSMLFIKYISDKYAEEPYAPTTIPRGASFKDMIALKGKPAIGDKINTKIIQPLIKANDRLARAESGALVLNGRRFDSPSAAAMSITGKPVNGWTFWEGQLPGRTSWQIIKAQRS